MDAFLDAAWLHIFSIIQLGSSSLNQMLTPLHVLGAAPVISLLALFTVCTTKLFSKSFTTKRYKTLEKDFQHWHSIREEAMRCDDCEKGKRMARNIDQAKLNKVYYDYFLEGFLLSMMTTYLPIACMAAYVNEYYRPERLLEVFQQAYLFQFGSSSGSPILIGGLFWYVISVVGVYLIWGLQAKLRVYCYKANKQAPIMA